jgi:hypothetical protein
MKLALVAGCRGFDTEYILLHLYIHIQVSQRTPDWWTWLTVWAQRSPS